jgi:hypothetical protein
MQGYPAASVFGASRWAACLVFGLIALGCGSETDAGSGGTSGGTGGTAQGGSGGSGASSASGGTSSGGGSGGVSGTSGSGGTPDEVLNPDLPAPSYDCRTDPNKQCVSIRGTIDGQQVDRHCTLATSPLGFIGNPPRWATGCEEQADGHSYFYRIDVLVQQAGAFHHVLDPDNYTGVEVIASIDGAGGDARTNNLSRGEVAGLVVRDQQTTDDIISGTFRASWGTPAIDCTPRYIETCASADVHGTFRMDYSLKVSGFP